MGEKCNTHHNRRFAACEGQNPVIVEFPYSKIANLWRIRMFLRVILLSFILLSFSALKAQEQFTFDAKPLIPDPKIQEVLSHLVLPIASEEVAKANLDILRKVPLYQLFPQLLIFSSNAKGTEDGMVPGIVMWHLKYSEADGAGVLAQYIGPSNAHYLKEINSWLSDAERQELKGPPNFERYADLLSLQLKRNEPMTGNLILRMYRLDPRDALMSMMRVYNADTALTQSLVWSDHIVYEPIWRKEHKFEVDDSIAPRAELAKAAASNEWWVRMYVAEIVHQHPELGTPAIVDGLKNDKNELVKKALDPDEKP